MPEERSPSQTWNLCLYGAGIMAVFVELFIGIALMEQVFSHREFSFHNLTTLFVLSVSLLVAPLPWLVIRQGRSTLLSAMLGKGASDDEVSKMEQTIGSILIVCYIALNSCVCALSR